MYYLFGGEFYYAKGGKDDFIAKHEDLDVLVIISVDKAMTNAIDWFHIVDSDMKIVCGTLYQAHGSDDLPTGDKKTFCYNRTTSEWFWM